MYFSKKASNFSFYLRQMLGGGESAPICGLVPKCPPVARAGLCLEEGGGFLHRIP